MTTEAQRLAEELEHMDHERWDVLDRAAALLRRLDFELGCANSAIIARDDREDKYLAALMQAREALEPDVHRAEWAVEQDVLEAISTINKLLGERT